MIQGVNGYMAVTQASTEEGVGVSVNTYDSLGIEEGSLVFWHPEAVVLGHRVDGANYVFVRSQDIVGVFNIEED